MNTFVYQSTSSDDTFHLAEKLGSVVQAGTVITLEGDLGAGKTTFTKGLAKGLGIHRNVNSPTFTIIKEYMGRMPLYHMDVYRIEDDSEDLGFEEYFEGEGVTVVEWAHLISDHLPNERLAISIFHVANNERRIEFQPFGISYEKLCKEIF
ncbi:tRNA (adenosine(37)-N6)-threonylcarbamoyltransferase complex ATPase subunit type 1 TsaE [Peribacillus alkalitolerans]|uniref:tRNA (adenosine(37)-N6)-threonylcarbamoyltransferase complex ATPase subunit type 1 TsaE n=1 Tax=Peribacillus alkalitolerans TaxID=1550385 RepID=UPI0013D05318|nr:tRNA (adenosine(37)-N6)-threonylcarbamoyltransferase complex ATPase subunit type 1 TsaE [Peribacillus alkalitolerans]